MKFFRTLTAASVIATAAIVPALAVDISGAGATFPYPIYAKWADAYKKETGAGLNYQSIGSGGGIKQIQAKTVTFGATDMPLKPEELKQGRSGPVPNRDRRRSFQWSIWRASNPASSSSTAPTLARIFLGEITTWNDPAIAKLNPNAKLPISADRRRPPLGRVRHDFHLDRLSVQGQSGVEVQGRRQHVGRMAGRNWRQGQRRRGQQRQRIPRARLVTSSTLTPSRTR